MLTQLTAQERFYTVHVLETQFCNAFLWTKVNSNAEVFIHIVYSN